MDERILREKEDEVSTSLFSRRCAGRERTYLRDCSRAVTENSHAPECILWQAAELVALEKQTRALAGTFEELNANFGKINQSMGGAYPVMESDNQSVP
jgi:hypothetical protein